MIKIILSFLMGAIAGITAAHFHYQGSVDEAFFEGGLSESAAMAKMLTQLSVSTSSEDLRKKVLTVGCISASNFLQQIDEFGVSFPGDSIIKEDAIAAYGIARENGIKNCEK